MEDANLGVHLHGKMHAGVFAHRKKGHFNVSFVPGIIVDYLLQNPVSKFSLEKSLIVYKGQAVHGHDTGDLLETWMRTLC